MDILCFKVTDSPAIFRAKDFTVIKSEASHKMNQVHLWEVRDFISVKMLNNQQEAAESAANPNL